MKNICTDSSLTETLLSSFDEESKKDPVTTEEERNELDTFVSSDPLLSEEEGVLSTSMLETCL